MIEHLNHKLIYFKSVIDDPEVYHSFKCEKCNRVIFYYKEDDFYWDYPDGTDYSDQKSDRLWKILELTCEDQQVKTLLE